MFDDILRRKEDEQKFRAERRLPPGQALTNRFPVLHYGPVPRVDLSTWDFRIWGEVEQPLRFTWEEFSRLPRTRLTLDIHCVTRWSKLDTVWEGVSLRTLIDLGLLKLKPTARFVIQHAEYGFTANLPLEVVLAENFLLATHYNGEPLTPEHGFPLRGVVGAIPGRDDLKVPYFWKGAKWLRGLEFSAEDRPGFWEQAGYHNEADVWKEQRYA
ncbi:sulfite oxidase-like oxidoreductase [Thermanaerothrix sp. 4228-RoL]|jgi:DMSO/TMAO reductase YedYZ molybdopterin-dependent catalytic subunit|uniref:Sulfite oxidase-like oxidoreductase n=1 Tax=Thermanaerothrix solaris TaxID=3058434 RepID=A0ABU3NNN1_9CHLR|nr:sulfite oxidase-like oxidoreductase [Thermanaerothrix sp. 4228-RoL]MDT8898448.1 sulfite oxidase-like oxidoreductase [Thermanaerothrix sp. 4228-RoL]